jgi:hypothetical protein
MLMDKIKYTYLFGFIEKDAPGKEKLKIPKDLFDESLIPYTTIKSIKVWFGSLQEKSNCKSLLGMEIVYLNYITGERKNTRYMGAPIESQNVEIKELNIKEGEYLSKMNLGFVEYITYLKFTTNKGEFIEFGIKDDNEKNLNYVNLGNNIILNLKGYMSPSGIRCLGCDFVSYENFLLNRIIDIFRIRTRLIRDEKYKQKFEDENEISKLDNEMKIYLKVCLLPKGLFWNVIKYL